MEEQPTNTGSIDYVRGLIADQADAAPDEYDEVSFAAIPEHTAGGDVSKCPFLTGAVRVEDSDSESAPVVADEARETGVNSSPVPVIEDLHGRGLQLFVNAWREGGDIVALGASKEDEPRRIVVSHPEGVREILTSKNYDDKGPAFQAMREVLGDGILMSDGDKWKSHRRIMSPAFRQQTLDGMAETMAETGAAYFDDLAERVGEGAVIDLQREMTTLTLNTLVDTLFGKDLKVADHLSYETMTSALEVATRVMKAVGSIDNADESLQQRYQEVTDELQQATMHVITTSRERGVDDDSILGLLFKAQDQDTGELLDDQAVRDEVFVMLFGGHETSALTMTWLFNLAEKDPNIMNRLQEEADSVLGDGHRVGLADLEQLPYTRHTVDETLRLRPAIPMFSRVAKEDSTLMGKEIKAGDIVMPFAWGVHRHPDYWDDPEAMNPDRFDESNGEVDKWAFVPFAGGKRVCIGKGFALMEMPMHLATMLHRFNVDVLPDQEISENVKITLRPSKPVLAHVSPR